MLQGRRSGGREGEGGRRERVQGGWEKQDGREIEGGEGRDSKQELRRGVVQKELVLRLSSGSSSYTMADSSGTKGEQAVCDGAGVEKVLASLFKKYVKLPSTIEYTVELDDPVDGDALGKVSGLMRGIREAMMGGS
eukprot:8333665-Pyramimonas_sp.AAC.1